MLKRIGTMDAGAIIGIFIVILLGATLLPAQLATWFEATGEGGDLADMDDGFIAIWNLVPLGVALTIFGGIIMVGVSKLKGSNMVALRRGEMDAGAIIGIFIVVLLGATLLPAQLATWSDATAVNGTLENAPDEFKSVWNLVPLAVALAIFAGIVMVGISKFKQM